MPNQPGENTVTASFTMPSSLLLAVKARAKQEMTNQSDILRRALMNSLSPVERVKVMEEINSGAGKISNGKAAAENIVRKKRKNSGDSPAK